MSSQRQTSEHLKQYLQQLTPQVRSRLLAELERLHLMGEDIPHANELIAVLRAEFRKTGQSHYRVGNPSRYFFQPLEPVLVNSAPERANGGQIARGSLAPIWSLLTEKLLPSMARDYIDSATRVIVASKEREAQNLAAAFRKKVLTYMDGILSSDDRAAAVRSDLKVYTSSHATFNDFKKMLQVIRVHPQLVEFANALPQTIPEFEGESFAKVLSLLDALRAKHIEALPFALTITAGRLAKPWQLIRLATGVAGRVVSRILTTPYSVAVSMVIDQIDDRRLMLLDALKNNRTLPAKEILGRIYEIEEALRASVDLGDSDWGHRLHNLMTAIEVAIDSEVGSIRSDSPHLRHILQSVKPRRSHSWIKRLSQMVRKSHDAPVGT